MARHALLSLAIALKLAPPFFPLEIAAKAGKGRWRQQKSLK